MWACYSRGNNNPNPNGDGFPKSINQRSGLRFLNSYRLKTRTVFPSGTNTKSIKRSGSGLLHHHIPFAQLKTRTLGDYKTRTEGLQRPLSLIDGESLYVEEATQSFLDPFQLIKRSGSGFGMFPAVLLELKTRTVFN